MIRLNDGDAYEGARLQKFFMEYDDRASERKQYVVESLNGEGLDKIRLPFHLNAFSAETITVKLQASLESVETIDDFEFFKFLLLGDAYEGDDKDEFEFKRRSSMLLRNIGSDYFEQADDDSTDFPDMDYCDITEKDMFGHPAITAANLLAETGGIWTYNGFRKLELTVKGLPEESSDLQRKVNLYWDQIDSLGITPLFEQNVRALKTSDASEKKFIAYIDTNQLGDAFTDEIESTHPTFMGRLEIHNIWRDSKNVFTFPISLCVHDTRIKDGKNHLMNVNVVSIDFGTSSTCAAVKSKGRNHLFTLSGIGKRVNEKDNAYENPTNLMIYRWDEIYEQWRSENKNCPFFLTISAEHDEKEAQYDSGYTVEDQFAEMEDDKIARNKMNSILTQIKMIPQLLKEGKEIKFTPFKGKSRLPVMVTDSLDENTPQKFNPIAFYGYLLSRAINTPSENCFYRRYQITYPVKFNKEVKEKIRSSLEYGIKRALPRSIQDAVDRKKNPLVTVQMVYPEPVACVGSIVGKQLTFSEGDRTPKLFAIYDLGGGTVDFSFGMFRPALNEDEEEEADQFIENFGVEGEADAGGEFLIHELAYKIYLDNRDKMESKRIKFVKPPKPSNPKGFEGLLSRRGDYIADGNVNIIKEHLARPMFIYGDDIDNHLTDIFGNDLAPDATHFVLPMLMDENGDSIDEFVVEVTGIDEFLENKIVDTVKAFKTQMAQIFENNIEYIRAAGIQNFNVDDVYIFLGGNASKQRYVGEAMNEMFAANSERGHIQRINGGISEEERENISDEYIVNEKTAVAFGQLDISAYGYVDRTSIDDGDDGLPAFQYNVGYIDPGNDEFVLVIPKNSKREWKKANFIDTASMTTNLYYTTSMTNERDQLIPLAEDISEFVEKGKKTLFIRINEENSIEFRIGGRKDMPEADEVLDEAMVLKLK